MGNLRIEAEKAQEHQNNYETVSEITIRRTLKRSGLKYLVIQQQDELTSSQIQKRLVYSKARKHLTEGYFGPTWMARSKRSESAHLTSSREPQIKAWEELPWSYIRKSTTSMPKRLQEVIAVGGAHTVLTGILCLTPSKPLQQNMSRRGYRDF